MAGFVFIKQKTTYEVRIIDCSSDVCSSDLLLGAEAYATKPIFPLEKTVANLGLDIRQTAGRAKDVVLVGKGQGTLEDDLARFAGAQGRTVKIGRASCRERVCRYV